MQGILLKPSEMLIESMYEEGSSECKKTRRIKINSLIIPELQLEVMWIDSTALCRYWKVICIHNKTILSYVRIHEDLVRKIKRAVDSSCEVHIALGNFMQEIDIIQHLPESGG